MGMYSNYTAKNQCWNCRGEKQVTREDMNGDSHSHTCGFCGGTGLPNDEQRHKAQLEAEGLCIDCEFPEADHPNGQGFPYGCLRLLTKQVHRLQGQVEEQQFQLRSRFGRC